MFLLLMSVVWCSGFAGWWYVSARGLSLQPRGGDSHPPGSFLLCVGPELGELVSSQRLGSGWVGSPSFGVFSQFAYERSSGQVESSLSLRCEVCWVKNQTCCLQLFTSRLRSRSRSGSGRSSLNPSRVPFSPGSTSTFTLNSNWDDAHTSTEKAPIRIFFRNNQVHDWSKKLRGGATVLLQSRLLFWHLAA